MTSAPPLSPSSLAACGLGAGARRKLRGFSGRQFRDAEADELVQGVGDRAGRPAQFLVFALGLGIVVAGVTGNGFGGALRMLK